MPPKCRLSPGQRPLNPGFIPNHHTDDTSNDVTQQQSPIAELHRQSFGLLNL